MGWAFQDEIIGMPGIHQVDTAPPAPVYPGMFAHAVQSEMQMGAEFIYLPAPPGGVAAQGMLVTYDQLTPASALAATGAKGGSPVAVAMNPMPAGTFGWFKVSGNGIIAKTAGAAIALGVSVGVTATPGEVATSAGGAGTAGALTGAVVNAAALAADTTVNVQISRPQVN
jgi:predicted RecA/RadA family phage recombinase